MLPTTLKAIRSILETDPTVSPSDRIQFVALLRHGTAEMRVAAAAPVPVPVRLIRRAEAARLLSCSLRTIDLLTVRGVLSKRTFAGRSRASGFIESEVVAMITSLPVAQIKNK